MNHDDTRINKPFIIRVIHEQLHEQTMNNDKRNTHVSSEVGSAGVAGANNPINKIWKSINEIK